MTRTAVILSLICVLLGALFYAWKSCSEKKFSDKGIVVFAVRDIAKGSRITGADVEERELPVKYMPGTSCWSKRFVVGRKATYPKKPGDLIDLYDLDPNPLKTVVQALRQIPEGAIIEAEDLEEHVRTNETPKDAMSTTFVVRGRAKNVIKKGQYFRMLDVTPEVH